MKFKLESMRQSRAYPMFVKISRYFNYLEIISISWQYRACLAVSGLGGGLFRADNSDKGGLRSR